MTVKLFSELGLSSELLKAIEKLGFEKAAPIQAEAIPVLLEGKDVVGQSQTGSGKTVAFAAPAIQKVVVEERTTQVLILCPTRELAMQVAEEVHKLALFKRGLHALPVYGGQSYDRQLLGLRQGAHIVIGTPGRVMDHMRRGTLRLNALKLVVLDETDVMLNMGFRDDIELILQGTPKERQTAFFSATIPRPIQQLIQKYSRDAQNIRIEQKAMTVPTVEQVYYEVDRRYKVELLMRLIDVHDLKLGIIFCNTRRMVDDLVEHLNGQGYSADRLHGEMTQAMRDRVMNRFRRSDIEFLVATDVAARGIDVENIEVVFNYDLPYDAEDYVHRIGRTGRQGRSGRAISFVSGREVFQIRNFERYVNARIYRADAPTVDEVEEARANTVLDKVRATLKGGDYKRQEPLIGRLLEEGFSSTDIASALLHQLQGEDNAMAAKAPRETAGREPRASEPSRPRIQTAFRGPESRGAGGPARPQAARPRYEKPLSSPRDRRNAPDAERPPRNRDEHAPQKERAPASRQPALPAPGVVAEKSVPAKPAREQTVPHKTEIPKPGPASEKPVAAKPGREETALHQSDSPKPGLAGEKRISAKPAREETALHRTEIPEPGSAIEKRVPAKPAHEQTAPHQTEIPERPEPGAQHPPKASRRTPDGQTRLFMNVGAEMGVSEADVVGVILGETGLPRKTVGTVDVRERHLFVDVASEHANSIIAKLNRAQIKGRKAKVKVA